MLTRLENLYNELFDLKEEATDVSLQAAKSFDEKLKDFHQELYDFCMENEKNFEPFKKFDLIKKQAGFLINRINNAIFDLNRAAKKKADAKELKSSGKTKKEYILQVARFEKIETRAELFDLMKRKDMGNGKMFNEVARELGLPEKNHAAAKAWKQSRPKL